MLDLLICNPWRPIDGWWQRAARFDENNDPWPTVRRDSGRGNAWIRRAARFRRALGEAKTDEDRMEVIAEYSDIYFANWIHEQAKTTNRSVLWGIEARILARQTNEEIAQANGCLPEVIEAFESLFFNVRDRLDNRDFILNSVLGFSQVRGFDGPENGALWKLFGYMAGPHVLEAVMSRIPSGTWVSSHDGVPAFFQDLVINSIKLKAALASLAVPVDSDTEMNLINSFAKYLKIEKNTDSQGQAQDQIQQGLQDLLTSLPFAAIGVANQKQLPALDKCAAEMRTDELMMTTVGMEMPGAEFLKRLRFPDQMVKA